MAHQTRIAAPQPDDRAGIAPGQTGQLMGWENDLAMRVLRLDQAGAWSRRIRDHDQSILARHDPTVAVGGLPQRSDWPVELGKQFNNGQSRVFGLLFDDLNGQHRLENQASGEDERHDLD
jgi:hypothetical protein